MSALGKDAAMLDELRRVALFTSGVAELTRHQAEQIIKDFVKSGDVRRQQASTAARELVERSKENRKELTRFLRSEIKNQIEGLGLASKRDVERLERRVARLESERKTAARSGAAGKTTRKSTRKPAAKKKSTTGTAGTSTAAGSPSTRSGAS
ncbi:MAG: hypothetical protein M3238_05235 [Actinomycetota bacterium]|nr:hypothetical protein [Actinomycetota bacterium]